MLSEQLTTYARERFAQRADLLAPLAERINNALADLEKTLGPDAATLLRYLYATLPLTDCFDVPAQTLAAYVEHALFLRTNVAWTRELPEGVFVHHVLCPRVNNEPVEDCRAVFYRELAPRLDGMDAYAAVREVNYWCCEHATYQTTDGRTLSPLGVLNSGSGRCGEESTFLVTALRSVGIPARQIYTPWWAHCDDNHAWVEAYANGAWHYLGACEPEEELDRGWFTNAAGRALMEETRQYSDFTDPACAEQSAGRVGSAWLTNVTASYARHRTLRVSVMDAEGAPAAGAVVTLEILNMSCWMPAAALAADAAGQVETTVGLGTLRVRATLDGQLAEATFNTSEQDVVALTLAPADSAAAACCHDWADLDVVAPADNPAPSHAQTPEQDERARTRKAQADTLRAERVTAWQAHAAELAKNWLGSEKVFSLAFGNADQIAAFLQVDDQVDRLALLQSLSEKDYRDASAALLEHHLSHARALRPAVMARLAAEGVTDPAAAEDAFMRYVACPRTRYEELSRYRAPIEAALTAAQKEAFVADPRACWAWLKDSLTFDDHQNLNKLVATPAGALASGQASDGTRDHLFVAICRTLGVPSRVSPVTSRPEFMERGAFVPVEVPQAPQTTPVTFTCAAAHAPAYYTGWTVGRLEPYAALDGRQTLGFFTQDLEGAAFQDGRLTVGLEAGRYRLVTSSRLPNGNQLASEKVFEVGAEPVTVDLRLREPADADLLNPTPLPAVPFEVVTGTSELGILAFTNAGMEPTEHLTNELADHTGALAAAGLPVTLVPAADAPEGLVERLARRTYVNPEALPLTLLVRKAPGDKTDALTSLFASAGYNVGTVDLLLRLAARVR